MIRVKKIKYSRRIAKRMFTPHFWRIFDNGKIVGDAQTLDIARRWVKRLKRKKILQRKRLRKRKR